MQIAGCTWGLRRDQAAAADAFDRAGFDTIDVDPGFGPAANWESALPGSCLAAGHLFPGGTRLDDPGPDARAAARRHVLLAVEPSPPRGLRTIGETREFIESLGVENFHILLDFAHCLLVDEEPVAAIEVCGARLAYVHFNDTDGVNDNHLGLTDGIFDRRLVEEIVAELRRVGYRRPLAVESAPALPDPLGSALKTLEVLKSCGA